MNRTKITSFLTAAAMLAGLMSVPASPVTAVSVTTETVISAADETPAETTTQPYSAPHPETIPAAPAYSTETTTTTAAAPVTEPATLLTNPPAPTDTTTNTTNTVPVAATDPAMTNPTMPSATETTPAVTTEYKETMTNPVMPGMEGTTTTATTEETLPNPDMPTETTPAATDPVEPKAYGLGDVTGDGNVNAKDANAVLIAAARIGTGLDSGLNDSALAAANVEMDEAINATDAALILRYAAYCGTSSNPPTLQEYIASQPKK